MVDTLIASGTTRTSRLDMLGTDRLTVESTGVLSVSSNLQAIRFNGLTTAGEISNSGTITNTAAGGRAIRMETSVGATFTATISNAAGALITSQDDAIQAQANGLGGPNITGGTITLNNTGVITSTIGQAVDFAGASNTQLVTNTGTISSATSDALRSAGALTLNNSGTINGGTDAAYSVGTDGVQIEANNSNSVTINNLAGSISGDRHGINAGAGTNVSVNVAQGTTITGRNGSGVGLDGSGTVVNRGTITGSFDPNAADINGSQPGQANGGAPDGLVDGDGDGIDIDGLADIQNHGLIQGTGAGGTGSDGRPNTSEGIAAGGGTITNFAGATISGIGLGILIDDSSTGNAPFATTIVNRGTISGGASFAIRIISVQNDTIDNAGTITGGGGTAIMLGNGNGTLRIRDGSAITGVSNGEGGSDTLDYSFRTTAVTVNLGTGAATGTGGVTGFEAVIGTGLGDTLIGGSGAETLTGAAGNDTLTGAGGNDTLDGGTGFDMAIFTGTRASYTLTRGAAGVTVNDLQPGGLDRLNAIEELRFSNLTLSTRAQSDFNGDFSGDLLLNSRSTGQVIQWSLASGSLQSSSLLTGVGPGVVASVGDFNGDGVSDLLLRNTQTGAVGVRLVTGGAVQGGGEVGLLGGTTYHATGDFNGDGVSDLLLRDPAGRPIVWTMAATGQLSSSTAIGAIGLNIAVVGAGDINHDGTDDFVLRDSTTGAVSYWAMQNGVFAASTTLGGIGSEMEIVGAYDLSGDNAADILLRNTSTGLISYWRVANGVFDASVTLGTLSAGTEIIGARDINGDGWTDILTRDPVTGAISALATAGGLGGALTFLGGAGGDFLLA